MIKFYTLKNAALHRVPDAQNALWVDVINPALGEDKALEKICGVEIPTREEMSEIEPSNRLYFENGVAYLTASLICNVDMGKPKLAHTTFILTPHKLITVRYDEPRSFDIFTARAMKTGAIEGTNPQAILSSLFDTMIDRTADVLEKASEDIEKASAEIFTPQKKKAATFENILYALGSKGDLISKLRESMVSFSRLLLFISAPHEQFMQGKEARTLTKTQIRDVEYLTQHCDALTNKVTFLINTTLGLVTNEQNTIIKIFSIVSVCLMPPTLVASIYGMNFKAIPEYEWAWGYPYALLLMLVVAIIPFAIFKWKKWL
jgi:magnesium transporter